MKAMKAVVLILFSTCVLNSDGGKGRKRVVVRSTMSKIKREKYQIGLSGGELTVRIKKRRRLYQTVNRKIRRLTNYAAPVVLNLTPDVGKRLLTDRTVKEFDFGFFSKADWELHFQVVMNNLFIGYKEVKREEKFHFFDFNEELEESAGNIDFLIRDGTKKYAVEFKVETWKPTGGNAVFGGQTARAALDKDRFKLRFQNAEDGTAYDEKWAILIARSPEQINKLAEMIDGVNADNGIWKWPYDSCWYTKYHRGYLAVLHREEKYPGECENQQLRKISVAKTRFFSKDDGHTAEVEIEWLDQCENDEVDPLQYDSASNLFPEDKFLDKISIDSGTYKKALPFLTVLYKTSQRAKGEGDAWEKHAQVMIARRFQCDTDDYAYGEKIREIDYPFPNKKLDVDFWLGNEFKVAVELKVEVQPGLLAGSFNFAKAASDEMKKLEKWTTPGNRRWFVAIMHAKYYNCHSVMLWKNRETSRARPQGACPLEWQNANTAGKYLGDREVLDSESTVFDKAYVWVVTTPMPNDVFFVLVCFEGPAERNCSKQ